MAIIENSSLGDIRGSVGGNTFVKYGDTQIMKSRRSPSISSSQPVRDARGRLATLVARWRLQTLTDKSNWKLFAEDGYIPVRPSISGKLNGYTAFLGCNLLRNNFNSRIGNDIIVSLPDLTSMTHDKALISWSDVVPDHTVYNATTDAGFNSYPFKLGLCDITYTAGWSFEVLFEGIPLSGISTSRLYDTNLLSVGFGFYLSEPLYFVSQTPKTKLNKLIASTGIIDNITPGLNLCTGVKFTGSFSDLLGHFRFKTNPGTVYLLSLVVFGSNSTARYCDSQYVTISS